MANYKVIGSIQEGNITLALKDRLDMNPNYRTVTWRARRPNGTNRRFYFEQGAFWTMQLSQAVDMLNKAEREGFFASQNSRFNQDHLLHISTTTVSTQLLEDVLLPKGPDDIFKTPDILVAICHEPWHQDWRKVMIACPEQDIVSFRSLTREVSYENKYTKFCLKGGWFIDRSMMDADSQVHKMHLDVLRQHNLA